MDLKKLYSILRETTIQFRKGEVEETSQAGPVEVRELYAMPPASEASRLYSIRRDLEKVDLEFLVVGVDKKAAAIYKDELVEILKTYPHPERLAGGPSYIEVGAEIGDQGAAFQLFALGKVLQLWSVITPALLGIHGEDARRMAGNGLVMISGFKAE